MSGHFKNDGPVQPILDFHRAFSIEWLDNTIGVELEYNVKNKIACKFQYTSLVIKLQWNTMAGCEIKNIKSSSVRTIPDAVKIPGSIVSVTVVYYYAFYDFHTIDFIW